MFYFFPSRSIQRRRGLQTKELLGGGGGGAMKPLLAKWGWGPRKKNPQILTEPRTELKMTGPKHNTTNTKIHIKNIGVSRMISIIRVNNYFRY